jgi:hypothetical protein
MEVLMKAIKDYLSIAKIAVERLCMATGQTNLMKAWKCGAIEKSNFIDGIYYEFHGVGVYIEMDSINIEVDFLPNSQIGGFDSWRLWQMIKDKLCQYPELTSHIAVKDALEALRQEGRIITVEGTHLYSLANCS